MNPSRLATIWIVTRESVFAIVRQGGGKLEVVSGRFCERIVWNRPIKTWRIHKTVPILFHVHRIQEQLLVMGFSLVFDQYPGGAIKSPHLETRPEQPSFRIKLVQPRHGMKATDGDLVLLIQAIVSPVLDFTAVEKAHPLYPEIEPRLCDFIRSPHRDRVLRIRCEFEGVLKIKVFAFRYGTLILRCKQAGALAVKNAQMGVLHKIGRQPADGESFKLPILIVPG